MRSIDARPLVARFEAILSRHALGAPGAFARWTLPGHDAARAPGPNPYGCADAANLLYTLGRFPRDPAERAAWVAALQAWQEADTGMFREPTHHPIHTTALCVAALELFDAGPLHPLAELAPLRDPEALGRFLDGLDWRGQPWTESHRGAGVYAALVLTGEVALAWEDAYFTWLARACDPVTGLWRRGCLPVGPNAATWCFPHLAGTFHYLFNLEYARRPHPHPSALVDTCLAIRAREGFPFAQHVGFAEIDWIYCLHRAARQSSHLLADARAELRDFAREYVAFLMSLDPETHPGLDDLHALFGAACALAELQAALPGEIRTDRPLRLVLDRRPFI